MRPHSVAIVGISSKAGSAGQTVLENLKVNNFTGDVHLVGRANEIDGRPVRPSVDELPEGIDLAIFTLPAAGVKDALAACVRRKVRAAVVFSSGFAEVSEEMRPLQNELSAMARDGDVALLGPNCLGYTNYVDGFTAGFAHAAVVPKVASARDPALAVVSQSGGFMGHLRQAFDGRGLPTSYTISPGNEAGLDIVDFVDFFTEDAATSVIVIYVEHIRRPADGD